MQRRDDVETIGGLTAGSNGDRVGSIMNIAIALAQFIMLALGVMASRILVNSGAVSATSGLWSDRMTIDAANNGVWFLLIPALWLLFAEGITKFRPGLAGTAQSVGVGIAVAVLAAIVVVLVF